MADTNTTTTAVPELPRTAMTLDQARDWAWKQTRSDIGHEKWTCGDTANFYPFFLMGWNYRGLYELQRAVPAVSYAEPRKEPVPSYEQWASEHLTMDGYPQFSSQDAFVAGAKQGAETALASLGKELGTLRWMSAAEGDPWDQAIQKVRERIAAIIEARRPPTQQGERNV